MAFENLHTERDYILFSDNARRTRISVDIYADRTVMRFDEVLEIRYSSDTEKGVVRGASRLLKAGVLEDVTKIYGVLDELPTHNYILMNPNFVSVLYGCDHLIEYLGDARELSSSPWHMLKFDACCSYALLFSMAIGVLYGILKPILLHYVLGGERMSPKMLVVVILEAVLHLFLFDVVLFLQKRLYDSVAFARMGGREGMGRMAVIRNRLVGFVVGGLVPLNGCIFLSYHLFGGQMSLEMELRRAAVAFFCGGFLFGAVSYAVERLTMFAVTGNSFNNEMELPYVGSGVMKVFGEVSGSILQAGKKVCGIEDGVRTVRLYVGRVFPVVFTYLISVFLEETSLMEVRGLGAVVENTIFFMLLVLTLVVDADLDYKFERYVVNVRMHPRRRGICFGPFL